MLCHKLNWLLLLLALLAFPVAAQEQPDPLALARVVPSGTDVFIALRTDEAYLDTLQGLLDRAYAQAAAAMPAVPLPPVVGLRAALAEALAQNTPPVAYADMRAALGDTVALAVTDIAVNAASTTGAGVLVVVSVRDQGQMAALIEANIPAEARQSTSGDWTLYELASSGVIALSADVLFIAATRAELPLTLRASLAEDAAFQAALGALPEARYNIAGYMDLAALAQAQPAETSGLFGTLTAEQLGQIAFGLTVLDETALVVDAAQIGELPPEMNALTFAPVDPAFGRFMPQGTDLLLHGANLTGYIEALLTSFAVAAAQMDMPNPAQQLEGALLLAGVDLEEDILAWTTGDFALYAAADIEAILAAATNPNAMPQFEQSPVQFGFVAAATDPAAAAGLVAKITTFAERSNPPDSPVTIRPLTLGEYRGTEFVVPVFPATFDLNLALMSSAEAFYFGTADYLRGRQSAGTLLDDTTYAAAQRYTVPDAYQIAYSSPDGAIVFGGLGLALLGPAIGNIFENIVDELDNPSMQAPSPFINQHEPGGTQQVGSEMMQIQQVVAGIRAIFHSATLSAGRQGNISVTRAVLLLAP